ncbi:hypothetical protein PNOK_0366200 [Pyrrhoderma noxium]|uniref:Thioredoxin-like fold domain-containing protein n=1 Tax=Pyrrhoderma noxium TaxID=2282107 RepID=A0A286UNJ1_9AGAM|nr:hypothetical protein PNOK_0366200 [Pyrrhoderma noxium]
MKLAALGIAAIFSSVSSAQYLSEGWKPGQVVTTSTTGQSYEPTLVTSASDGANSGQPTAKAKGLASLFDLSTYLELPPVQALLGRAGVNITEKLESARAAAKVWDERIPLITDYNYNDVIVEEEFDTLEEERDRVWFIIISITSVQNEGVSKYVDEQFDKAFNLAQESGELPHVRWGRIDYMNVTTITTKWNVWRAPFLVVLKDRGQTLRFYRPGQIRLQGEVLHEFLKREAWEQTPPWRSAFGPGGDREFVLDYLAIALTKIYDRVVVIPRWLLLLVTGSLASIIVNFLHSSSFFKSSGPERQKPVVSRQETGTPASRTTTEIPDSGAASPKGASKRKKSRK